MISRRAILSGLIPAVAIPARAGLRPATAKTEGFFAPIEPGAGIGFGWSLEATSPPLDGALFLHLIHDSGKAARVRVCRLGEQTIGVAQSGTLDFVIIGSAGPTEETLGRAVVLLAEAARANERRGLTPAAVLQTHEQHLQSCRV